MIARVETSVVDNILDEIEANFGKMTITRIKTHECFGMKIDSMDNRHVQIDMRHYLQNTIAS